MENKVIAKEYVDKIEIPFRLPSLNEYIKASKVIKGKWNAGNQMKQDVQDDIMVFLNKLPRYTKPIQIHFHWVEENKRRDLDNVCFAKKFILDSMVKAGKLKNDNRNFVSGFIDTFEYAKESKVILEIKEV
jgi:Holliday junction resolvase RusA-like endonuclease